MIFIYKPSSVLVVVSQSVRFIDFAFCLKFSGADFARLNEYYDWGEDIENTLKTYFWKRSLNVYAHIYPEEIWIAYTMMRTANKLFNDILNFLIVGYWRKGIQDVTSWFSRQWTRAENRCSRRETERGIKYKQVRFLVMFYY